MLSFTRLKIKPLSGQSDFCLGVLENSLKRFNLVFTC